MVSTLVEWALKELQLVTLVMLFVLAGMIFTSALVEGWAGAMTCMLRVCFGVLTLPYIWACFQADG